jgi:hypothetical protein
MRIFLFFKKSSNKKLNKKILGKNRVIIKIEKGDKNTNAKEGL